MTCHPNGRSGLHTAVVMVCSLTEFHFGISHIETVALTLQQVHNALSATIAIVSRSKFSSVGEIWIHRGVHVLAVPISPTAKSAQPFAGIPLPPPLNSLETNLSLRDLAPRNVNAGRSGTQDPAIGSSVR